MLKLVIIPSYGHLNMCASAHKVVLPQNFEAVLKPDNITVIELLSWSVYSTTFSDESLFKINNFALSLCEITPTRKSFHMAPPLFHRYEII